MAWLILTYHHNTKLAFLAFIFLELVKHFYLSVWTGFPAHAGVTGLPCSPPSSLCKRKFHSKFTSDDTSAAFCLVSVHTFYSSIYGLSSRKVVMQLCCLVLQHVLDGLRSKDSGLSCPFPESLWKYRPLEDCGCALGSMAGSDI